MQFGKSNISIVPSVMCTD